MGLTHDFKIRENSGNAAHPYSEPSKPNMNVDEI